ncbi:hypothetical protein [Dysgonomonas reticulitermitis]
MYEKNDKRYVYNLIDEYLKHKIDEVALCDGMYFSYVHEIDESTLNKAELEAFSELEMVTKRFSEFENDFELAPGAYYTKEQVRLAAIKAKERLQNQWPDVLL